MPTPPEGNQPPRRPLTHSPCAISNREPIPTRKSSVKMRRHSGPIHFLTAVNLSLGALVLLDAGL